MATLTLIPRHRRGSQLFVNLNRGRQGLSARIHSQDGFFGRIANVWPLDHPDEHEARACYHARANLEDTV